MYPNYMNKPAFMTNTGNTSFGGASTSFGQPAVNTSMFSSMPQSNIFQTPSTSSFATGPTTQSSFESDKTVKQPPSPTKRCQDGTIKPKSDTSSARCSRRLAPIEEEEPPRLDPSLLTFTGSVDSSVEDAERPSTSSNYFGDPPPPTAKLNRQLYTLRRATTTGTAPMRPASANYGMDQNTSARSRIFVQPHRSPQPSTSDYCRTSGSSNRRMREASLDDRSSLMSLSSSTDLMDPDTSDNRSALLRSSSSTHQLDSFTSEPDNRSSLLRTSSSTHMMDVSTSDHRGPLLRSSSSTNLLDSDTSEKRGSLLRSSSLSHLPDPDTDNRSSLQRSSSSTDLMDLDHSDIRGPLKTPSGSDIWIPEASLGTNLFGQQSQPSTSGLFGTSNAFGQNKATFGFSSTPSQTGLFGQQPPQQTSSSLFQPNSTNLFGSSAFGNQTTGTVIKFSPVTGSDTMQKNGVTQSISTKHHCITCMKEYEGKSLEELRFEDYSCNRKGPQQQAGFGTTPFGTTTSGAPTSLFGAPDNKQTFGQAQTFGQTPVFGQPTPAFGVTNQSTTPSLFGKTNTFGPTTSTTSSFSFNSSTSTSNPFSATQTQKPFSQQPLFGAQQPQAQSTFGPPVFGPTNTQNTGTNLFQKPAQLTTGFNSGQQGFSFNQTPTTQASNLFQVSKPSSVFGIFPQTTAAPAFGQGNVSFIGRTTQPTFTRPTQPTFGVDTTGMQQTSLFNSKPPSLFSTTSGGSLFNNVFQQTPASFSLNVNQQHTTQFPPEVSDESKNILLLATDSFPDGPHVYGLEPILPDTSHSTTNPSDLKALLDYSKKREEMMGTQAKLKVQLPKPKRGNNYSKEFFETNQTIKSSAKCLVIRKFNDNNNTSTIYNKYRNELLEEAEECLRAEREAEAAAAAANSITTILSPRSMTSMSEQGDYSEPIPDYKGRLLNLKLQFDNSTTDDTDDGKSLDDSRSSTSFVPGFSKSSIPETRSSKTTVASQFNADVEFDEEGPIGDIEVDRLSSAASLEIETPDNPAGVVLTRAEYYMYPAQRDLGQYVNDSGECVVQGLTIGRKGYGNVYFPDPIDISNMNFDELVYFRHREVIIYPDDNKKPPLGEGLNRRAQVTLDKIYPREKGTCNYITDVDQITQSSFVENLMRVTQKHNCVFVEYRPATGSWVFKVKHFSKYSYTDSDEDECSLPNDKDKLISTPIDMIKEINEMEVVSFGLGGSSHVLKSRTMLAEPEEGFSSKSSFVDYYPEEQMADYVLDEEMYHTESAIQTLKSSLFTNLNAISDPRQIESVLIAPRENIPSEVITMPRVYKLPDISLLVVPNKVTTTQRCYTELGVFRCNTFKVGWDKGFNFYTSTPVSDNEVVYSLTHCNISLDGLGDNNSMMPNLTSSLTVTLEESDFSFDQNNIPTLDIRKDLSYLQRQTHLFNDHVRREGLRGREKYFCSVWNLCSALWGPGDNSPFSRRQNLSNWLKKFSYDLSNQDSFYEKFGSTQVETFRKIFNLLSFYRIPEACELANKKKLDRLCLLISQQSANDRFKFWMQQYVNTYVWREKGVILDDYKKLYLLLAGLPGHGAINTCEDLDWMRSFGLHLWYIAPVASPIDVAFNMYKKAFEEAEYATKPIPSYCDGESQSDEYDVLYHILALYVDRTYQLSNLLHPETYTENVMDYSLSWLLLQLFLSLDVGLVRDSEKAYIHTTFSTQLENMGHWKWAIFPLLFLKNNILKKNLIMKILNRNLATFAETAEVERELVQIFKIPSSWIHEVKATKAQVCGKYYDRFQHYIHMGEIQEANNDFINHILPDLFVNEQFEYLMSFLRKLEQFSHFLVNWQSEAGLIKDFLELQETLQGQNEERITSLGGKLSSLFRKINCFPVKNDQQKLCVAELSRKCAFLFNLLHKNMDSQEFRAKFVDILGNLVLPPDMKHYEIFYVISKFTQNDSVATV